MPSNNGIICSYLSRSFIPIISVSIFLKEGHVIKSFDFRHPENIEFVSRVFSSRIRNRNECR